MAFYNNFPATYNNPYYAQPQVVPQQQSVVPQPQVQTQTQNNNIIWVTGEAGAKSYLVAPNTTVQLWDSEAQVIYLKSADASGMPSIKTLDYTIRTENQPIQPIQQTDHNFISREEFNGLKSELEALQGEINKLKPRNNRKEKEHNE